MGRTLCAVAAMSGILAAGLAWAQEGRGRVVGRVTDPSGAVVPKVAIRLVNVETEVALTTTTNEQGAFDILYVPPGRYRLSAEFTGFKRYTREGIEVRVDDLVTVDFSLEPGQVTEAITVTAETPLLETGTSLGQVVDTEQITELPLAGTNPYTLAALTAGVQPFAVPNHPSLAPAVEVVSNFSVGGSAARLTDFSLDGAPSMWGRNASFVPPPDLINEFKVETARYDASGRSPGGSVNVALKSGTNAFHGSLAERHNNNRLMGIDFFQRRFLYDPSTGPVTPEKKKSVSPQHVINHFSATANGPVILPGLYQGRSRTFWIYGFEGLIRPSQERGDYYHSVPTPRQRTGDFSELLAISSRYQIYDPATVRPSTPGRYIRDPFPGNVIPRNRLDAVAQGLLKYWPDPNLPGTADFRNNYWGTLSSFNQYFSHLVRVDHTLSPNNRMFVRYSQSHQEFRSGKTLPTIATGNRRDRYSKGAGFDFVSVLTPRLLLNFRYTLTRFIETFLPDGAGFDLAGAGFSPRLVREIDPQGLTFPQIAVDQLQTLGNSFPSGSFGTNHVWGIDFSRPSGNHTIRFGADLRVYLEQNRSFSYNTPQISFGTNWTRGPLDNAAAAPNGQGLASFLLGLPTGGRAQVNDSYAQNSNFYAGFVQDDWRVTPRLTLNAGLRYEFETAPTERYNRSVRGFDFVTPNPIEPAARANYAASPIPEVPVSQFRAIGGLQFAGAGGLPRALWQTDHKNFAPRLGLAWRLRNNMVIRTGYGLYYITAGIDRIDVNQAGYTQQTSLVASLDNGQTFLASLANPFPNGYQRPAGASGGLSTDVGRTVSYFTERRPHGYQQRWSFSVQRQFPRQFLLDTAYVGSRGTKLEATRQVNPVPRQYLSTLPVRDQPVINFLSAAVNNPFYPMLVGTELSGRTVQRAQLLRAYPHFTGISTAEQVGYSWYHSLQVRLERRMRGGILGNANYTWSKFMGATAFLNPTDPLPEKVISNLDRQHRFTTALIWQAPVGRGRRFGANWRGIKDGIAGGWRLSAIYQANSGPAIGFGNILFYGNLHDIPLPPGERTVDRWFNTEAGFERDSGKQLAQNIRAFPSRLAGVRANGNNIWNWSASKSFRIVEKMRLEFRCDWLNATNHSHFAAPNATPTSTAFGTVTGTTGYPRQIYFWAKLTF